MVPGVFRERGPELFPLCQHRLQSGFHNPAFNSLTPNETQQFLRIPLLTLALALAPDILHLDRMPLMPLKNS